MNGWSRGSLLLIGLTFLVPRLAHAQEAAEVTCKDGTTSKGGKGACSGHGGVDKTASTAAGGSNPKKATRSPTSWGDASSSATAPAASAAPPASAAAEEVTCKDGTTSHGGKGACSGHGGVDKSAPASKHGGTSAAASTSAPTSGVGGSSAPPAGSAPARTAAPAATATAPATPTSHATGAKGPPTAKCKDGSLSYAQHHTGACSDHGGVAEWLDGTQK
jgi:hypothetical protein